MYKKCVRGNIVKEDELTGKKLYNTSVMWLWEDDDSEPTPHQWSYKAFVEDENGENVGLNGEKLKPITNWVYSKNPDYSHNNTPNLHFQDMSHEQRFLIEMYGTNDEPSKGHRELYYDIECEIGGALTEEYIERAPMPITTIAYWDKTPDEWVILVRDKKKTLKTTKAKNKKIISCESEAELLDKFIDHIITIRPDILVGYNSDYFDNPYLYYRMCNVLGKDRADQMSPLYGKVKQPVSSRKYTKYVPGGSAVKFKGIESLDYMKLHKKYSWKDEPSWRLDAIGEKYAGVNKIEYEGNLDQLFETDIYKYIQYNFRDVEILKLLDEKLQYIALTKNICHKGKHNYEEVYFNSITQDGAISAYLLSQGIIPPSKEKYPKKKFNYAGGYLFCSKPGLYKNLFDLDLTSLYPSIIMSLNIGKETFEGRIIDTDDRNSRLGLNDLEAKDPDETVLFESKHGTKSRISIGELIKGIKTRKYAVAANGSLFSTDRESTLSTVLSKWFDERVFYKDKMKEAYKAGDTEQGEYYHLMQYTMKILLNSLYGATALPNFRYGMNYSILSEAITLSGHRIIQESALCANRYMNKVLRDEIKLEL